MPDDVAARAAVHGEKMIELRLMFWTDHLAGEDQILPKHGWDAGVVLVQRNSSHGIVPRFPPRPFRTMADLPRIIEKVLIENGIKLHRGPTPRKYIV
jgi:hypothetical protein